MIVKVTQEHKERSLKLLKQNIYLRTEVCPVALSLKDLFKVKFACASYVDLTIGIFPFDNIIFSVKTLPEVAERMEKFDTEGFFEPFEFELPLEGVKL